MDEFTRASLKRTLLKQDVYLSEYDIFQRIRYFLHTEPELWDPETCSSFSSSDKVEVLLDMMSDMFEDSELLEYMRILTSPLVKKMRVLEDRLEKY